MARRRGLRSRRGRRRIRRAVRLLLLTGISLLIVLSAGLVLSFRWLDPPTSSFIVQRKVSARFAGGGAGEVRQQWLDWSRISPHAGVAVVAAEDQRFADHRGFDLDSIKDAIDERRRGGRVRGASSISQQVAKNLFLWSGRSWVRKGLEAYFTILIEAFWPKRRILEVYLNIAQFGDRIFGVQAASRRFFAIDATQLSAGQAALLAAVLPNPRRLRVDEPSPYVRERADWIREQMRMLGGPAYLRGL